MSVKSLTNFAQRLSFWLEVLLRAINLQHGTNGFTSLPKEIILGIFMLWKNPSTPAGFAVGQVVVCTPVTQWAWVRSPVGTSFLGEVFWDFSSPVRQMLGSFSPPKVPEYHLAVIIISIIIHYGRQWPEMLMHPKTSNIHTSWVWTHEPWIQWQVPWIQWRVWKPWDTGLTKCLI